MRDDYASHLPVLALAVHNTEGRIIEMGAGFYSTPMLWGVSQNTKRHFLSYDQDEAWALKLAPLFGTLNYSKLTDVTPLGCGLLFIDGPYASKDRGRLVHIWRDYAEVILCHDTQPPVAKDRYNYDFSDFPYQYTIKYTPVWTTILSHKPLPWANILLSGTEKSEQQ